MVEFKTSCGPSYSGTDLQESDIQNKIDSMVRNGFEPVSIGLNDKVVCVIFRKEAEH